MGAFLFYVYLVAGCSIVYWPIVSKWIAMFVIELTYKADLQKIDAHMAAHVRFLKKYYASGNFLVWVEDTSRWRHHPGGGQAPGHRRHHQGGSVL